MYDLISFQFKDHEVRWFQKGVHTVDTPGGTQRVTSVNLPAVFTLILRSRKPEAKPFRRWVTHEVLPQIMQTGRYIPEPQPEHEIPQTYADALRLAADALDRNAELEKRIEADAREVAEYIASLVQQHAGEEAHPPWHPLLN